MKLSLVTHSAAETEQVGHSIGAKLRGSEVIELRGDVGGGKTTLTKGIVAGAGSEAQVGSPTFTVTKHYPISEPADGQLSAIIHADMYRLQDPGIIRHELADALDDRTALVIEWAESIADVLPDKRVVIELRPARGELTRDITISAPDSLSYLLQTIEEVQS